MNPEIVAPIVKYALMFAVFINVAPIMNWVERRACAFIQDRPGPNRVGPLGLFQPLADAVKFLFKEDVTPTAADRPLYLLAPALALLPAFTTFVVIPFGPDITVNGRTVPLVVANVDTGVLIFLAISSLSVYSLVMAGYASNNKFSLLGSIRASAQLISYELALTIAVLAVLLPVASQEGGSFNLAKTVAYQQDHLWMALLQPIGFLVFLISSFAETNRLPFDLPEAESELVAGFHTEYSAMRFALFFQAEYTNMAALSALGVTLYLGGWSPWPGVDYPHNLLGAALGLATLVAKIAVCMGFFVWIRWTFPRFRYDQLMRLGWKVLLPLSILNLIIVAALTVAGVL